jgi:ribosome assembly protein 4
MSMIASTTATTTSISKTAGGWGGSLVGSTNPNNNLGYRTKRLRPDGTASLADRLPSSVVVQFKSRDGELLSSSCIDIPTASSVDQMSQLVHQLKRSSGSSNNDDDDDRNTEKRIPYTLYATVGSSSSNSGVEDEIEVTSTLADVFLQHNKLSTEDTLVLTYQPLAVFRVRPVT